MFVLICSISCVCVFALQTVLEGCAVARRNLDRIAQVSALLLQNCALGGWAFMTDILARAETPSAQRPSTATARHTLVLQEALAPENLQLGLWHSAPCCPAVKYLLEPPHVSGSVHHADGKSNGLRRLEVTTGIRGPRKGTLSVSE